MKPASMGIGLKLALGFFMLALLPLGVLGYIIYDSSKADIIDSTTAHLVTMTNIIDREIRHITLMAEENAVILSLLPQTQSLSAKLLETPESATLRAQMFEVLSLYASNKSDIQVYFLLHPFTGEVLVSSDPAQEGKFFDKRNWFSEGRKRTTLSKVTYSSSDEKSVLAVSTPVMDEGRLVGVIVGWINLEVLGNTLIQSEPARSNLINRSNLFAILSCCNDHDEFSQQTPIFTEASIKALEGRNGSGVYKDSRGIPVIGAYRLVKDVDLALVVELPLSVVLQHVNKTGTKILIVAAVLIMLIIGSSLYIARRITEPLVQMSRAAGAIAAGNLNHRIEYKSNDEIGLLSDAMNSMVASLASRDSEINKVLTTLNTLLDQMPEGVVMINNEHTIVLANPIGKRILSSLSGATTGDRLISISGKPIMDFLVSPPQIMWHEAVTDTEPRQTFELAGRNIESDGSITGMVLVMKDVTEERAMAQKLQAQDRLAAVGQLASGIAHDFNNILTCVIGYSEIILQEPGLNPVMRGQMEAIYQSGERAGDLIAQILDFSRKTVNELKTLDLLPFIKEFMRFIQRIIPESITLKIVAEPGPYLVRADISKLQQVLANLAVNARDAISGQGSLTFRLARLNMSAGATLPTSGLSSAEWILLEISDTGEGIPSDVLPHIFEPFYTTKPQGKGTGLGLAQVYGIVKQHGGFIDVNSTVGKGTKFTIYIPGAPDSSVGEPDKKQKLQVPRGSGQRILVVEDEPVVRNLIVKMLTTLNYQVTSAENGEEAIDIFKQHREIISLVLTDIVMPNMDGMKLSEELRKISPSIRIIAISGYPMNMDRADLEELGIVDWIQKPLQIQSIANAVSQALTRPY